MNPKPYEKLNDKLIAIGNKTKLEGYDSFKLKDLSPNVKSFAVTTVIWTFLELGWAIIGLFTYNWIGFIILLLWNIFSNKVLYAPFKKYKTYVKIYTFIVRLVLILFILFVTLNSFHLHIDLKTLIFG